MSVVSYCPPSLPSDSKPVLRTQPRQSNITFSFHGQERDTTIILSYTSTQHHTQPSAPQNHEVPSSLIVSGRSSIPEANIGKTMMYDLTTDGLMLQQVQLIISDPYHRSPPQFHLPPCLATLEQSTIITFKASTMVRFHGFHTCLYIDSAIAIPSHSYPFRFHLPIPSFPLCMIPDYGQHYELFLIMLLLSIFPLYIISMKRTKQVRIFHTRLQKTNIRTVATFCGYTYIENYDPTEDMTLDIPWDNYGAYKRVDKKVKPVPGVFPEDARVERRFPEDPLENLPVLSPHPPDFSPTMRLTRERIESLKINPDGFMWPEEVKLFLNILRLNENAIAFMEDERSSLRDDYFSPYIIPVIPHVP